MVHDIVPRDMSKLTDQTFWYAVLHEEIRFGEHVLLRGITLISDGSAELEEPVVRGVSSPWLEDVAAARSLGFLGRSDDGGESSWGWTWCMRLRLYCSCPCCPRPLIRCRYGCMHQGPGLDSLQ